MRSYFSIAHLAAASQNARAAGMIEASFKCFDGAEALEHKGCVTASLFMSVAAVEAFINEFFSDCAIGLTHHLAGLDTATIDRLGRAWTCNNSLVERAGILEKYDMACLLADKPPYSRGSREIQDVAVAIAVRNALMHYKPQSIALPTDGSPGTVQGKGAWGALSKTLLGYSLKPNPYSTAAQPEFPYRMLSHDFAARVFESALRFLELFAGYMELTNPPIRNIAPTLKAR
jgi:hypothetical protein